MSALTLAAINTIQGETCNAYGAPVDARYWPRLVVSQQAVLGLTCIDDAGVATIYGATDELSVTEYIEQDTAGAQLLQEALVAHPVGDDVSCPAEPLHAQVVGYGHAYGV